MAVYSPYSAASSYAKSYRGYKGSFFDTQAVMGWLDKKTRKAFSKFGAYVRTAARSSIRYSPNPSRPGNPPHAHKSARMRGKSTSPLRDLIYFAYDPATKSVVIGPDLANQITLSEERKPVRGTVPKVLEEGGSVWLLEEWTGSRWQRLDFRRKGNRADAQELINGGRDNLFRGRPIRRRAATYAARPFMHPARNRELPKLMLFMRDA